MPKTVQEIYCPRCKETKPVSEFYKNVTKPSGYTSYCKICTKLHVKEWQKKNQDKKREYAKKWTKDNPEKVKTQKKRWHENNPGKHAEYKRRWALRNPRKERNRRLIYSTGITLEQYEKMLKNQNGVCAICFHISPDGRALCVDHDHKTGKIRGLLCTPCNTGIGLMCDDTTRLINAVKYLS